MPDAFQHFVEPLGVSKWDDTLHHDSRYDVAKTLELYDALYRSVPTRADLEAKARAAQATADDSDDDSDDNLNHASDLAESLQPAS